MTQSGTFGHSDRPRINWPKWPLEKVPDFASDLRRQLGDSASRLIEPHSLACKCLRCVRPKAIEHNGIFDRLGEPLAKIGFEFVKPLVDGAA